LELGDSYIYLLNTDHLELVFITKYMELGDSVNCAYTDYLELGTPISLFVTDCFGALLLIPLLITVYSELGDSYICVYH
jgi:hypothetical protein